MKKTSALLLVDVRHSKMPLLKLPNVIEKQSVEAFKQAIMCHL